MQVDWIEVLRNACAKPSSQTRVAKRLGVSATLVSQVLSGTYEGRKDRIEARVRGELMREKVYCPVLEEISQRRCQDEQRREFAATNPLRVAVHKACRSGCPHFLGGTKS